MKTVRADQLKAEATRALLTCRCSHNQASHLHSVREGAIVGRWLECMEQGCRCRAFLSQLTASDKVMYDKLLERRVESSQLAAILSKQEPKPNQTTPALRYQAAKAPKKTREQRRQKERVRSAPGAAISGLYHGTATKKPNGKYVWEEL